MWKMEGIHYILEPSCCILQKKRKTFSRFALEILTCNANIKNLKTIGIDLESIICTDECHSNTLQINICEAFNEKRQEKACGTTT